MHRMRHFLVMTGFVLSILSFPVAASAALIRPDAGRSYPDIAADINGQVEYTYDPSSQTGQFYVRNTPYLLAVGSSGRQELTVQRDSDTGVRRQELLMTLDQNGNLVTGASNNMYALYGTVVTNGQTYSGLLLKGTPTAFGSQDLGPVGIQGSDVFDVNIDISGGALAPFFGKDVYMRITPELQSTFQGRFDESFTAQKATSNTRAYNAPIPFPIPEPTALMLLVAGTGGLIYRNRRRLVL